MRLAYFDTPRPNLTNSQYPFQCVRGRDFRYAVIERPWLYVRWIDGSYEVIPVEKVSALSPLMEDWPYDDEGKVLVS